MEQSENARLSLDLDFPDSPIVRRPQKLDNGSTTFKPSLDTYYKQQCFMVKYLCTTQKLVTLTLLVCPSCEGYNIDV